MTDIITHARNAVTTMRNAGLNADSLAMAIASHDNARQTPLSGLDDALGAVTASMVRLEDSTDLNDVEKSVCRGLLNRARIDLACAIEQLRIKGVGK